MCFCLVGNAVSNQPEDSSENSGEYYPPVTPYQPSEPAAAPVTSVTGFYGGVDIGLVRLKNKVCKDNTDTRKTKTKSGLLWDIFCGYNFQFGKVIVGVEILAGMEYARPKVFSRGSATADENSTTPIESTSLKRKYSFGLVPHIGYNVVGGFNVYFNFGTTVSKYNLRFKKRTRTAASNKQATANTQTTVSTTTTTTTTTTDDIVINEQKAKKNKTKASMLLGLGLEQNFGPFFVRAECNKLLGRKVGAIEEGKERVKTNSYTFKLGGGYRF
jgi:opacity protein-like surface antigen